MPDDLLRQASQRLGIMSLLGAALWAVGTLLGHITFEAIDGGGQYHWFTLVFPTDAIAGVSIVISLALFAYTRRSNRDPAIVLDLGLG
jgi:hypothetical protein